MVTKSLLIEQRNFRGKQRTNHNVAAVAEPCDGESEIFLGGPCVTLTLTLSDSYVFGRVTENAGMAEGSPILTRDQWTSMNTAKSVYVIMDPLGRNDHAPVLVVGTFSRASSGLFRAPQPRCVKCRSDHGH